jgi:hypothetical protein
MPAPRAVLRRLVLSLGGIETLLVVGFVGFLLSTSDPWGQAIGRAVAGLVAVPYVLFVLPTLIMGLLERWLPLALSLLVIAAPATLLALRYG